MSKELRTAIGCFATGVTIVTARYKGQDYGMTVSSFNAVSLEPAMALWNIQKDAHSIEAFEKSEGYTVSVLNADQGDLAMHFTHGTQEERFAGLENSRAASGRVVIPDCVAWFDCDLAQVIEAGDHAILLSNITSFGSTVNNTGLIYERSKFGSIQDLKEKKVA